MVSVLDLPSTRAEAWRWADLGALSAAAALAPIAAPEHDFLDLPGARRTTFDVSSLLYLAITLVGLAAFLYPFWLPAEVAPS